jgi:hypothetical protein
MSESAEAAPLDQSQAPATPAQDEAPVALEKGGVTTFAFENAVFQAPGVHFACKGPSRTPMFCIDLGGREGVVELTALRRQFKIEAGSHDDEMIILAARSLKYVPEIRPGDNVPNEILDGSASWRISPKHAELARKRLEVQMLSWVSGKEIILTNVEDISSYLEQDENKTKLRQAFRNAAKALGHDENDHKPVLSALVVIGRELGYIEALREWFSRVLIIAQKLKILGKVCGGDKRLKGDITQMQPLFAKSASEFQDIFRELDAQTGEIMGALKSVDRQIAFIRERRDALHQLSMEWTDTVALWNGFTPENAAKYISACQTTYRFLAVRHASGRSLLNRGGGAQMKKPGGAVQPGSVKQMMKDVINEAAKEVDKAAKEAAKT